MSVIGNDTHGVRDMIIDSTHNLELGISYLGIYFDSICGMILRFDSRVSGVAGMKVGKRLNHTMIA